MPRHGTSGTKGLFKQHTRGCTRRGKLTDCDCQWKGKYEGHEIVLAKWARCKVDPRTKGPAVKVLIRFFAAVDNKTFDHTGERPALGTKETVTQLITEYTSRVVDEQHLSTNSLGSMLNVLSRSRLGGLTLEAFAIAPDEIESWLNETGKLKKWTNKTWTDYRDLLNRICKKALGWKVNGKPRLAVNPVAGIARKVVVQPEHFKNRHLVEEVEAKLFEAVELLNRPMHQPTRTQLTWDIVAQIRAQLATESTRWKTIGGKSGKTLAALYGVSPAVISAIKHGDIWNAERQQIISTRGTEMERRLIAAFDMGLRAGEMLQILTSHVKLLGKVYEITLPPAITKGGKRTGKVERVYAATPRAFRMVQARMFQLRGHKPERTYLFGTEEGKQLAGFKRVWRDLFTLAGLDYGRDKGLVWHTTRHEFISRLVESGQDVLTVKEAARHKQLETTEGYMHTRRDKQIAAFASLGGK